MTMPPTFSFWNQVVNILQVRVIIVVADVTWQLFFSENKREISFVYKTCEVYNEFQGNFMTYQAHKVQEYRSKPPF
jgi:hypothetical protein